MRVEFYLVDAMEVANFAPIYRGLVQRGIDARMVAVRGDAHAGRKDWLDLENAIEALGAEGIRHSSEPDYQSDVAITTQKSLHLRGYEGLKVRVMYTVGLYESQEMQEKRARGFDAVLVLGPYAQRFIARWLDPARVVVTGFPKYDDFFSAPPQPSVVKRRLGVTPAEKIIAYLPTWEKRSSIDRFFAAVETLAADEGAHLLVKPHHCTPRFEPERYERLKASASATLLSPAFPSAELFVVSDLVIADALSGALGESILTDPERPLVCLCPDPHLLASQMDSSFREICPIVTRPDELAAAARELLRDGDRDSRRLVARRSAKDRLFAFTDGTAARRAADAIIELASLEAAGTARTKRVRRGSRERSALLPRRGELLQRISNHRIRGAGGEGCFALFGDRKIVEYIAPIYLLQSETPTIRWALNRRGWETTARALARRHGLVVINGIDASQALTQDLLEQGRTVSLAVDLGESEPSYLATLGGSAREDIRRVCSAGFESDVHQEVGWAEEFHRRYHVPSMLARHGTLGTVESLNGISRRLRECGAEFVCVSQRGRRVAAVLAELQNEAYLMYRMGWLDGDPEIYESGVIGACYWFCLRRARELRARRMLLGSAPQYLEHGLTQYKLKWNAALHGVGNNPASYRVLIDPSHAAVQRLLAARSVIMRAPLGGFMILSGRRPQEVSHVRNLLGSLEAWYRLLPEPHAERGDGNVLLPRCLRPWFVEEPRCHA